MRIYIASPYTLGDVEENVKRQIYTAERLIELGHAPYVPLLTHFWHKISPHTHEYWLDYDFYWLKVCNAVLRLDGESKGADLEVALALSLNMPVFYNVDHLPRA